MYSRIDYRKSHWLAGWCCLRTLAYAYGMSACYSKYMLAVACIQQYSFQTWRHNTRPRGSRPVRSSPLSNPRDSALQTGRGDQLRFRFHVLCDCAKLRHSQTGQYHNDSTPLKDWDWDMDQPGRAAGGIGGGEEAGCCVRVIGLQMPYARRQPGHARWNLSSTLLDTPRQ